MLVQVAVGKIFLSTKFVSCIPFWFLFIVTSVIRDAPIDKGG